MLVSFDELPETARIWIYQAKRKLTPTEVGMVKEATERFLHSWKAHGKDLKSSFKIEYDQFLILSVDENHSQPSGCSIDASVHLIQQIEHALQISFSTNGQVAFQLNDEVQLKPFNKIKEAVTNQIITADTKVFDNTVQNLAAFKDRWVVRSNQTWLSRYFEG